jgi:clan AA aspartic protease
MIMGVVYAEITIKNVGDVINVGRRFIQEKDVRNVMVNAMVDTGAGTLVILVINEDICRKLDLAIEGFRKATFTDSSKSFYKVTEPVKIHWKDRTTACMALVVPGDGDVLLGAFPLEDMDLIIHPASKELTGAHGDEVLCMLKRTIYYLFSRNDYEQQCHNDRV